VKLDIAIRSPLREAGEIKPEALTTSSASTNPTELIGALPEVERLTLPTGTEIFRCGDRVQAIHVVERGLVELSSGLHDRIRYGPGELFFYGDLVGANEFHRWDAKALTPLSLLRLNRASFLSLIHRHPTLVLQLVSKQHSRLRQQRADARHFY